MRATTARRKIRGRGAPGRASESAASSGPSAHPSAPSLLLASLAISGAAVAGASSADRGGGDTSYDRYPSYPPYCSTPDEMRSRSVPPLLDASTYFDHGIGKTRLVQVVPIIRHGARTPWSDRMECWDGYWQDPETGVWDCDLTTIMSPPSPPFVSDVEVNPEDVNDPTKARAGDDAMFLFEKRYDALHRPPELSNAMNGTCMTGQLLLRGYEQEMTNGRHLRDAYVKDGTNKNNMAAMDERIRLFDLTEEVGMGDDETDGDDGVPPAPRVPRPYEPPNLYYRVDDEQRTLMSGEILLRGLFGDFLRDHAESLGEDPMIITHTADYHHDVLAPRSNICPRVEDLWLDAEESKELVAYNETEEVKTLRKMMVDTMGRDFSGNVVDCLMTSICTDRPLPDVISDYGNASSEKESEYAEKYGSNRFERLINFEVETETFHHRYNDAAYSKLGIGPLWHEILRQIRPVVDPQRPPKDGEVPVEEPAKLALFSGHDSTLHPLLASLGGEVFDGRWAPYASMLIIEIHEITGKTDVKVDHFPSNHAFRLLFNGRALTSKMDGCQDDLDLCDVSVLFKQVEPFAILDRDCTSTRLDEDRGPGALEEAEKLLSSSGGILLALLTVVASAVAGGLAVYVYLMKSLPFTDGARRVAYAGTPSLTELTLTEEDNQTDGFENDEHVGGGVSRDKDSDGELI